MFKHLIYFFYLLCCSFSVIAQEHIYTFLSIDNGLVNNEVTSIKQDIYGFLWFGTRGGLNHYDGYNLKLLRNKSSSANNLSSQAVEAMYAGKEYLWIGTKTGGLNKYDFLKDSVTSYTIPDVAGVIDIFSVYEDKNGDVYVGSSKGLYYLNQKTKKFKQIDKSIANSIVADDRGMIWAATTSGLRNYNGAKKLIAEFKFGLNSITLTSLAIDKAKNTLYIGSWNKGLFAFNYITKAFKNYTHNPKNINSLSNDNTYRVLLDQTGVLWVGTWGGGLNKFNINSQSFTRYIFSSAENSTYFNKVVLSIEQDHSGVIWFGTEGGIYRINPHKKKFYNITHQYNKAGSLLNAPVVSVLKDSNHALWIGTKDGGLVYSNDGKTFSKVNLPLAPSFNFRVNAVFQNGNKLWIGTNEGLFIMDGLNPNSKISRYISTTEKTSISANKITAILKDKAGILWLGTQSNGLNRVIGYKKTGEPLVKRYELSSSQDELQSERITSMFNDNKGRLWIGTFNGLHLYNRSKDGFKNFQHYIKDSTSISNSIILSIAQDQKGTIWIGTPNGLNKLVERKNHITFKNYFAGNNFPNDYIHAILPDKKSRIWISTNKGIVSFNTNTEVFKNFDIRDGLLSNAFAENAAFADAKGMFYFGGIKGITYFHPDSIKINEMLPPVYFTNLIINNKQIAVGEEIEGNIVLKQSLLKTQQITLNYKQDFITISFAALDYHASDKNQYAYRLKGFEQEWVNAGRRRNVTYTNLPAGNYILEVKASNSDNIWNNKGAALKITILPPPWKTWWAKLIYITVFLFLLWLSRYIGLNRLRLKNKLELANLNLKREREITEIKSKLFTNISHEFRTPLTLMIAPLDDLSRTENLNFGVRKTILSLQDQAKRLLNLVNQLLDFQKAEVNKLTLNASKGNIVSFSKQIFYSFRNEANRRNIKFQFSSSSSQMMLDFDEEKMTIILYNLLANAFKFSESGGTVSLTVNAIEKQETPFCEIIVSDTGKGISESEKEKIFDRFYQVAKAEAGKFAGTGIGLAFTKDLVLLHNGSIKVDSELQKGSSFRILLPLHAHHEVDQLPIYENLGEDSIPEKDVEEETAIVLNSTTETVKPIALIVEDNIEVNEYLVSLLQPNYQTFTAFNGKEGLALALDTIPDVIISDVMMPEMDGYELCHAVKSALSTSHIPVILLTAQSDSSAHLKGVNKGADVYLSKPFNSPILLSHVRNVLESRKKLKELFTQKVSLGPSEVEITSFEGEFIKKIITKIEENLGNSDFNTDELAEEMNMSRSTFYRKLKAITDMSGSEFIRFIKIQRSAQLLLSGEFTIKQIAYEVGFNDTKHFRKCFIKQYNMTPSDYIKKEGGQQVKDED
ncbi:hybrid sensor histidine kinase/response regulator transcription factor [Pedobacter glucosidilyticus]|uniref:hybrid sensor histidine kinase/response regulator transcription factor n=1 Tax=Pedobacter glucosidilyticus TaxID=1122941 RepID=UPI0003FFCFB5|nr:two-component regulator propeller domain-containing protein [Pedobacter glucosidilyticus]